MPKNLIKSRLFPTSIILAVIGWALFVDYNIGDYRKGVETANRQLIGTADAFSENTLSAIKRIDLALLELTLSWSKNQSRNSFIEDFNRISSYISDIGFQVAIIGTDGQALLSTLEDPVQPVNLADREHFRVHLNEGPPRLFISAPVLGRVSKQWSVQFSRPILRNDALIGVMVVSINPKALSNYYDSSPLGEEFLAAVVKDDGRIVTSSPFQDDYMGRRIGRKPFLEGPSVNGTLDSVMIDETSRTFGYVRIPAYGLTILCGLPEQAIRDPLLRQILNRFAVMLALTVFLVVAAKRYDRRIIAQEAIARNAIEANLLLQQRVAQGTQELALANDELMLAASVFENTMEGILVTDADGTIISVNAAFSAITGYSRAEAVGRKVNLLRSERHDEAYFKAMWQALVEYGSWQGEIWNRRKSGEVYLQWLTINRVDDADGRTLRYVSIFHDITKIRDNEEKLRLLAFHDSLTGLPNRTLLEDRLAHAIDVARRDETPLAVMFVGLDNFKVINDSLGHDAGDELLMQVGARLKDNLRRSDTIARPGGDEFVVVVSHLSKSSELADLAEKIIEAVNEPMHLKDYDLRIGASVGIAIHPADGRDHLSLMKAADAAMYRAKEMGRGGFCFFRSEMADQAKLRLGVESELRRASEHGEFELHYQPKIALRDDRCVGVEALIRWRHPTEGLLPPGRFIPVAEESGLIKKIGDWVLEEAFRQIFAWRNAGLTVKVAINVASVQLSDTLLDRLKGLSTAFAVPLDLLEVELTESSLMENQIKVADLLGKFRSLGVTVAVDDFGTGYSSLAYLQRLPIDILKIDRSFLAENEQNDESRRIVETIVALGKALGLETIAEGVETESQRRYLAAIGCDVIQGYLTAKPMPPAEFEAWLSGRGVSAARSDKTLGPSTGT